MPDSSIQLGLLLFGTCNEYILKEILSPKYDFGTTSIILSDLIFRFTFASTRPISINTVRKRISRSRQTVTMLPPAAATTLILALSRIISPNLTEPAFNNWYDNDLLPAFMTHQNATLGLRFKAYAPVTPAAPYTHLALYKTTKDVKIGDLVPSTSAYVPPLATTKRDIGPQDVEIKLSVWKRIHVFESLRSRKNQTEGTVSKIVMAVMLEPRAGKEAEVEVEEWYHKQVRTVTYPMLLSFFFPCLICISFLDKLFSFLELLVQGYAKCWLRSSYTLRYSP
ncbi:hypothetical protein P154DRAFT_522156 [Amniculicola lignicola CBS 123094]|uniref:Uncharacterized protein n=1 Tax=Amniculicola lignicola CBS 123094 TaxID=1392246 RepID=A0A6A5WG51_9PLEO|nr:hypothetical protein P154DRAFT_522156 [Amniculicola lignicola CBS 123094]